MPASVVGVPEFRLRLAEFTITVATTSSPTTARISPWLDRIMEACIGAPQGNSPKQANTAAPRGTAVFSVLQLRLTG
jgi:hypothetical protein